MITNFFELPWHTQVMIGAACIFVAFFVLRCVLNFAVDAYDYVSMGREARAALKDKPKRFWRFVK